MASTVLFSLRSVAFRGIKCTPSIYRQCRYQASYSTHTISMDQTVASAADAQNKTASEGVATADDLSDTAGVERWELLQRVKGIEDPFQLNAKTVPAGTKLKPTIISTICTQRTVGCICEKDSPVIKWMRLGLGETKCCECGHWFKLVPLED